MRRYLRLVDQPVEVGSGTVSRIAREPFRLDVEALLGAFDQGLGGANLGLADGARRLDVHDDAELHGRYWGKAECPLMTQSGHWMP